LHNPEADPERTRPYTEEDTAYREYRVKLCRIRDRMLTPEGRRLAAERQAFMEEFFRRLNREVAGELQAAPATRSTRGPSPCRR